MDSPLKFAYWWTFSYFSAMKRLPSLLSLLLLAVLLSCHRKATVDGYPFSPATGNDVFDSITAQVWHGFDNDEPEERLAPLVDKADSVSRLFPSDRLMRARVCMMRGDVSFRLNNNQRSHRFYGRAVSLLDSATYPHDYNKAKLCYSLGMEDFEKKYETVNVALRYFENVGDSLNTALVLRFMLNLQHNIVERVGGHEMALRAERIYESLGLHKVARCNRINIALTSPDSLRAVSMTALLNDPVVCRDPAREFNLLVNCCIYTDSIEYLDRAEKLRARYPRLRSKTFISVLQADHEMRYGDLHKALPLALLAKKESDSTANLLNQVYSLDMLAQIYEGLGMSDSALVCYRLYVQFRDSINVESQRNRISTSNIQNKLEREKQKAEYKIESMRLWIVFAVAVLLILCLAVMLIVHRRISRRRLERLARESELRHSKARLAARAAVIKEEDQMLKSIREAVQNKNERNELVTDIEKILKLREMAKREGDNYVLVADEVNPDFKKRLREECPGITESQMALASYIAAGMTNQQIARIQNISYDSVKKARYRLRRRLNLATTDSLEERLRSMM